MGLFSWGEPKFPKLKTQSITRANLRDKFKALGFRTGWGYLDISADPVYRLPAYDGLLDIIFACPSDGYQYIKHRRDCDDAARIFLGWLSQQGHGDLAIGWIKGWLVYPDKEVYHKMCWGMTTEGLYIFEPQNNNYIWKHGERIWWGPNATWFRPNTVGI